MNVRNPGEIPVGSVGNPIVVDPLQLFFGLLRPVKRPGDAMPAIVEREILPNQVLSVTLPPKNDI